MYYCYPIYFYPPQPQFLAYRQFPEVDPDLLYDSANETKKLMKEASVVLDRFASSKGFDKQVMTAAQESNMDEVKRLIKSIGITSDVDVHVNPDGLRLEFVSMVGNTECCRLTVALRWNKIVGPVKL
ncbi:hypothetical protein [Ornithinibacillus sp. 179-J 7C1 HS]|uniref:hypothetical protein n=1 Tax=Ornithinibacillus sp. 179-J 7C1 HS TaxID=3142384 RepID=UPI0039A3B65A